MTIDDVVEDLGTGVAHPDFIGIGIAEHEAHCRLVPILLNETQLVPHVSVGLRDQRQNFSVENATELFGSPLHAVTIRDTVSYVNIAVTLSGSGILSPAAELPGYPVVPEF